MHKKFLKFDLIVITLLLIIGIYFALQTYKTQNNATICQISVNNKAIRTLDLEKNAIFELDEHIAFEVKNKSVRFLKSNCKDKICLKYGFIKYVGQAAICLPNKVVAKIK